MSRRFAGALILGCLVGGGWASTQPRPFDCTSPPEGLTGLLEVEDPVPGRFILVMGKPEPGRARALADIRSFASS